MCSIGLPKNEAAALEMYRKAAKLGSVEAEERLGEILDYDDLDSTKSDSAATHSECGTVKSCQSNFLILFSIPQIYFFCQI